MTTSRIIMWLLATFRAISGSICSQPEPNCDVAEFGDEIRDFRQATVASFNALREDFGDLRTNVDRGFTEMRGKFDAAAAGQQRIAELIQGLIADQGDNGPRT